MELSTVQIRERPCLLCNAIGPNCVRPRRAFPLSASVSVVPHVLTGHDRESLGAALGRAPDPRGARYLIVAMLIVEVCAMLARTHSYPAIGE